MEHYSTGGNIHSSKVSAGNSGQRLIPDTYIVLNNSRIPASIIWYANAVPYQSCAQTAFFLFVWGRRKKGSGGFPTHFLCSRIYNF